MTWQTRYPDLAKGIEQVAQREALFSRAAMQFKPRTLEEATQEHKEKLLKLKDKHPEIYNSLPSSKMQEPDWGVLINPKVFRASI